jgi:polyhydroxybutyrate depolymerase
MLTLCRLLPLLLLFWMVRPSQEPPASSASATHSSGTTMEWKVDGVTRTALVFAPPAKEGVHPPLVFAFHGHGGSGIQASRSFRFQTVWPEAVIVYMNGLPTPGALTDPQGTRNGWQKMRGDQKDRDLAFFDAVLATMRERFHVDDHRIYATGHSNGGSFTYLLWGERGNIFAAFAPCAAVDARSIGRMEPHPAMHIAGRKDPLVRFAWQERMIQEIKTLNRCEAKGQEWAKNCILYPSPGGTPVVTYIHDGGHTFPADASELIVRFFKEIRGPESAVAKP